MSDLAKMECIPSKGADAPLRGTALEEYMQRLGGDWQVIEARHLEKTFSFKDFRRALDFTNLVGELAESVDHHPEISLGWGFVRISIWTHSIGGLHEADFVFAAKTDQLAIKAAS
jgi:4a-hydroxytetrahydrobiopterin dehydratase